MKDLSYRTEFHNKCNHVQGIEYLTNVYFRVDVPDYVNALNDSSYEKSSRDHVSKFYEELVAKFENEGWTQTSEYYKKGWSGYCPEMCKGAERVYIHPQSLSGEMSFKTVCWLEVLLSNAETCTVYKMDVYEDVAILHSDEEAMKLYHLTYDDKIRDIFQALTTTKRCNLWKRWLDVVYRLHEKIYISSVQYKDSNAIHCEAYIKYANEKLKEFIDSGWLKKSGEYIRWASKKEQKELMKTA